ncbi:MAG: hypothetical protein ABS76_37260 [Pelagibacterium sp. SCN 64-44]|nr:MAG: hypothetical protein ABS76_37260 [Pelagibacterium sp. SCN 64-44]
MSRAVPVREKVAAHRARLREAGRTYVTADLPDELIREVDRIKVERRVKRAEIIEAAVRSYIEIEKQRA